MEDYINEEGRTVCGTCEHVIQPGEWPFCPHPMRTGAAMIVRDEIPGGVTVENYGPKEMTFYSHSERWAYMRAHGLQEKERFCPFPGTDKDPQGIPNPRGYVDAKTLENAAILITRNGARRDSDETEGVLVNLSSGPISERDVIAVATGEPRRSARVGRRTNGGR